MKYDVAIVGMGIVGLAHAHAAARAGQRVVVIDREERNISASIQNFGFVTVTGQRAGDMWSFARRSRDIWAEVAPKAGIAIDQRGLSLIAQRDEAVDVIDAFSHTDMGEDCDLITASEYQARFPGAPLKPFKAALYSPHELRVEPRLAIPKLAAWLAEHWGVSLLTGTSVLEASTHHLRTTKGNVSAETVFVCTGDALHSLFPQTLAKRNVTRCQLNMLRLTGTPQKLPTPIMSDLSLVRYDGFDALKAAAPLRAIIEAEKASERAAGIHLIAVQAADGSLVVGDSHIYGPAPVPFQRSDIDEMILGAFDEVVDWSHGSVIERWLGAYAYSPDHPWFTEEVVPGVHMTLVTSGAGMSTAFGIGEQVVSAALNTQLQAAA